MNINILLISRFQSKCLAKIDFSYVFLTFENLPKLTENVKIIIKSEIPEFL